MPIQRSVYFALFHIPARVCWTAHAASYNLGVLLERCRTAASALASLVKGSPPPLAAILLAFAAFLASDSETLGKPPSPLSVRLPPIWIRCTQDLVPFGVMFRYSPPPSPYRPSSVSFLTFSAFRFTKTITP